MLALTGAVLIVAPPTLHRQGLLLTLQQAWPSLDLTITADAGLASGLLRRQPYRLVVVDGVLLSPTLPRLLELLLIARANQQLLLFTGHRLPAVLRLAPPIRQRLALLPRHSAPETVLGAIGQLLGGESGGGLPGAAPAQAAKPAGPPTPFSQRELEVLHLAMADCSNQEIAAQLCLSVRTVESHRRALLQKAGAKTLIGLAVQAVRQGWIAA